MPVISNNNESSSIEPGISCLVEKLSALKPYAVFERFYAAKQIHFIDDYTDIKSDLSSIHNKYRCWKGTFAFIFNKNELYLMNSGNMGETIQILCDCKFASDNSIPLSLVSALQNDKSSKLRILILEKHYANCRVDLDLSLKYFENTIMANPYIPDYRTDSVKIHPDSSCSCAIIHKNLFKSIGSNIYYTNSDIFSDNEGVTHKETSGNNGKILINRNRR